MGSHTRSNQTLHTNLRPFTNFQVFLCADLWKDPAILHAAYCDSQRVTDAFIKNGMQHALRSLGNEAAGDPTNWDYDVRCSVFAWLVSGSQVPHDYLLSSTVQVVVNKQQQQVEMWLVSKADTGPLAPGIRCAAGERVLVEVSRKYTPNGLQGLAYHSGFYLQASLPRLTSVMLAWQLQVNATRGCLPCRVL